MEIKDLQIEVDEWIKKYGVRYFNELTNMAVLTEEVGELARLVSRQYGEQSFKSFKSEKEVKDMLSEELADIVFVVACLANQMNIDLEQSIKNSFIKKSLRDKKRHLNNPKLNNR